jgi:hypothetical protein
MLAICTLATAQPSTQVTLSGALRQTLTLDAATLAAAPAGDIGSFLQTRSGEGAETRGTVRGVRLRSLIERAGLAAGGRDGWKTLVVVATATDGYRAVFSWPEIANTPVGDGVLVLFERDGQPLPAREGAIALVSTTDRMLGARHVRNLARIEVRALPDAAKE